MNDLAHPRPIVTIPLRVAALCAQCESVFVMGDWDHCPACADGHFLPLESIIGTIRSATETPDPDWERERSNG